MNKRKIFGTREWAEKTANCIKGCSHDCLYCYAKCMAIRFGRKDKDTWCDEEVVADQIDDVCRGKPKRVMFPSTHDITPGALDVCVDAARRMLAYGHFLLIVSKPHAECIKRICADLADYREQVLFRFTIGSADNQVLRFWEPNAPLFEERVECLRMAKVCGFKISVSCEPMLDDGVRKVISEVKPHAPDSIWIGIMNRVKQNLAVSGASADAFAMAKALMLAHNDKFIRTLYDEFKDDPVVRWKDSIKKILGLNGPEEPGMDI